MPQRPPARPSPSPRWPAGLSRSRRRAHNMDVPYMRPDGVRAAKHPLHGARRACAGATLQRCSDGPMKLFDDTKRADTSPALFSESSYQFVNRVAGAPWDKRRALLEAWFVEHPANATRDLYNRFTDIDDSQHLGAWWELYIASLFRLLGYDVAAHPTVEGSKRQPDFLMSRGNTSFYVECTVASPGDGAGTRGTPEWIYDCISDVENPDFLVGIHRIAQGTQRPKHVEVTRPIAQWLGELDPDALLAAPYDQLPRRTITIRDWVITF